MNEMMDIMVEDNRNLRLGDESSRSPNKKAVHKTIVLSQQSMDTNSKIGCGLGDASQSSFRSMMGKSINERILMNNNAF